MCCIPMNSHKSFWCNYIFNFQLFLVSNSCTMYMVTYPMSNHQTDEVYHRNNFKFHNFTKIFWARFLVGILIKVGHKCVLKLFVMYILSHILEVLFLVFLFGCILSVSHTCLVIYFSYWLEIHQCLLYIIHFYIISTPISFENYYY